uniref:Uncharacterized protein n=1 Tax=Odontella aurita TaxID=265563 RepID=A0A6U6FJP5_9STRA
MKLHVALVSFITVAVAAQPMKRRSKPLECQCCDNRPDPNGIRRILQDTTASPPGGRPLRGKQGQGRGERQGQGGRLFRRGGGGRKRGGEREGLTVGGDGRKRGGEREGLTEGGGGRKKGGARAGLREGGGGRKKGGQREELTEEEKGERRQEMCDLAVEMEMLNLDNCANFNFETECSKGQGGQNP